MVKLVKKEYLGYSKGQTYGRVMHEFTYGITTDTDGVVNNYIVKGELRGIDTMEFEFVASEVSRVTDNGDTLHAEALCDELDIYYHHLTDTTNLDELETA